MSKRINALSAASSVVGTAKIAIDAVGWASALSITVDQLKTYIGTHYPVSLSASDMGLSLGTGATAQQLTLSVFSTTTKGVCPKAPAAPDAGIVLNALGQWVRVFTPGGGGGGAVVVTPPDVDAHFGVNTGKYLFNVDSVNTLGTASLYSVADGEITTDDQLNVAEGVKFGTGIIIKQFDDEATLSLTATGKYFPVTVSDGVLTKTVYVATYEALP